jgi:TetR/AcrR family transcriptional repressor of cmeABC operon
MNTRSVSPTSCPATVADTSALPRTQRGRERREKILAAAEDVFFEYGFEAASVGEIVKRSGGSLATLYKQFGTKEELFESLLLARTQSLYDSLSVDRLSTQPPDQVLLNVGLNLIRICASEKGVAIYRIVMAEGARFPHLRDIFLSKAIVAVQRDLGQYLMRQVKAKALQLDDPLQAAKQFLEMVKGDAPLRLCCGESLPSQRTLERHVHSAVNLFLRGALPR